LLQARITYRFHPRFGETVGVRRRLERGGAAFLVVQQLDGTFACLPAWMTDEAASRFEINVEPRFPLDVLRFHVTRSTYDIVVFPRRRVNGAGEITLEAAASFIGVCNMTAMRMLRRGEIKGRQACAGAPWVIRASDLAAFAKGKRRKPPLTRTDEHYHDHATCYNVKDRGLVVLSSCGHVGIVNSTKQALEVSGVQKVHALVGGFHLGASPDGYLKQVIGEIKALDPDVIIPMHCSGDNFARAVRETMPDKLIQPATGPRPSNSARKMNVIWLTFFHSRMRYEMVPIRREGAG
jgi:hypothetical protein